jgi:hypothetical protein
MNNFEIFTTLLKIFKLQVLAIKRVCPSNIH